jgi:hypothetical protein
MDKDDPKVVLYKRCKACTREKDMLYDRSPYVLSVQGLRIAGQADLSRYLFGLEWLKL